MRRYKNRLLLLLLTALALIVAGCANGNSNGPQPEEDHPVLPGPARPTPDDPEYYAYILTPQFWGQGIVLEGSPESGYLLIGFNVPKGTLLYAPFAGVTGAVSLTDYSSDKSCKGCSLCAPGSLNGFSAYNVTGAAEGPVEAGDLFARVSAAGQIFPRYYGKVNLILEFNLFDVEAADYAEMQALFEKIFDHLLS